MQPRSARLIAAVAIAVPIAVAGCAPSPQASSAGTGPAAPSASAPPASAAPVSASPSPQASLDRAGAWRDDLERIVPGLERIHPNPFHGTPKAEMEAAVEDLAGRAADLSDDELMVGVLRIGALISAKGCDGHSGAFPWGVGTYPLDSLPLRLWLFPDDEAAAPSDAVVVVDALPPYQDLIGSRIDTVEGRGIAEVRAVLDPVLPRDNDQTIRLLTPRYLLIPQVLRGLGLADDGAVTLGITKADGTPGTVDVDPVPMAAYNAWAGEYGLHLPANADVRYLSKLDEDLWWEVLPDGETLYVQYNRVERLGGLELQELRDAVTAPELARVVLDIRHNFGGEVPMLDQIVPIFDDPAVDQPGKLSVLVGRNTWSAGSMLLARLEDRTGASLVGEPMAGCPTFYGDIVELRLPHSGLTLLIAEMLEVGVDPNDPRSNIDLDAEVLLTQEDWQEGRDPVLELVLPAGP